MKQIWPPLRGAIYPLLIVCAVIVVTVFTWSLLRPSHVPAPEGGNGRKGSPVETAMQAASESVKTTVAPTAPAGGEQKETADGSRPKAGPTMRPADVAAQHPPDKSQLAEKPGTLHKTTLAQIGALIAEKETRTPAQVKMDSALIYLAKQSRGEKIEGAPQLQLDVKPDARGMVEVDITATVSPDLLAAIQSGGGSVVNQVASERAIRARLPVAAMEPLAERNDVQIMRPADKMITNLGTVVTEGDRTHRADAARATFGVTGAGIKIGVMSNGVDSLAASIANGNINSNVSVLPGQAGSGDEGTAMLEIVQDLAPGAQLYFATANPTTAQFAQNIRDLAAAGCTVIVDDVGYYSESPFQDATVARAVVDVSAAGVMYFSSAGNSGNKDVGTSGNWEGDFVSGGTATLGSKTAQVLDYGGGVTSNTVNSGGSFYRVDLFWADPLGASTNDYDFFVIDSTGAVLRSATTIQNGTQDPYETTSTLNVGERIVVVKTATAANRFIHLDTGRGRLTITTPGKIRGHNGCSAVNAFGVAAVSVASALSPAVFVGGATNPLESFSTDGPRRMFFNPDGTAITPGDFSSTGGQVFQKPDIAAADGVTTSVSGFAPFFGTSAAAPHAAAIAALIRSSNPALTPAQVRVAMTSTSLDIQGAGVDRDSGSGIVMAYPALQAVSTPGITSFSPGSGLPNTSVVITGIGLSTATSVTFNGVSATFTADSPSQITTTVPAGATTGPITVVGPLGTASSLTPFTVFDFSPMIGAPGTSILLTGSGFTGATAVSFNGTSASYTVNSDTQITTVVPIGATPGPISVTTPGGAITSSTSFTALSGDGTPTIGSFTPSSGAVGSSVTMTGTNYVNVTNVAFNGVAATSFTVNSQTQITATVPVPSGSVTGSITVTTGYGTATSSSPFNTLATLAAFNAATDVTMTGNGFTASGAIYVSLNFAPVTGTSLTLVNNTGLSFIGGTYSNLSQGQLLTLNYNGVAYNFAVNYYGGTGNDLVLQWASNRAVGWGLDNYSQLGNNNSTNVVLPTAITTSGALAGKTIKQVAAGGNHTLALCTDGTLIAWGSNGSGQLGNNSVLNASAPVLVSITGTALAGKTVTAIAAGLAHSLALCSDGTIVAWGFDFYGQLGNNSTGQSQIAVAVNTTGALSGKTVTAIAAGTYHSLARCSDGTVVSWGYNATGQLGNNSTTQSLVPVAVTSTGTALAGKTVTAIAGGSNHSVALCSDGSVASWGLNSSGQLGNNSTTQSLVPVAVSTTGVLSGKTVSAISTVETASHTLALCTDGTVVAWGSNTSGQLGIGSFTNSLVPVAVITTGTALVGKTVAGVFAGGSHSLVLCSDGTTAAWGGNLNGQLGNDSTTQSTTATAVATLGTPLSGKTLATLSGGGSHSLALCSDGTTAAWGYSTSGQIGNSMLYAPTLVAMSATGSAILGKTLFSLCTGGAYSLALCSDGSVAAWGYNINGQLGNGTTITSYVPTGVTMNGALAGKTVVALAAGSSHSLALCSDGTVAAWGYNGNGQLGNNSTTQSTVPVAVTTTGTALAGKTVVAIAAGSTHSLALCSDGTVAAWGYNGNGQLGNNSITQSTVPVFVTMTGVLSGKTVTAIAAGNAHSLAMCSDGTVAAWGYNGYGQLGNNSFTNSSVPVAVTSSGLLNGKTVTAISAGSYHNLVLCSGGTLAAWGLNTNGQLGNNSTTQSLVPAAVTTSGVLSSKVVTAIACGFYHSLALCSDGSSTAWGYAADGELGNNSQVQSTVPVLVNSSSLAAGERFVQAVSSEASYHSLGIVAGPPAAQILVQQSAGGNLTNGSSTVDFGSCLPGASTTRTFTLVNNGTAPLTISGVTLSGTNAADFAVTAPPASTVAVGGSTTFVVTFTPGAALSRSGVLQISSNDPVNGSFAVNVAGAGNGTLAAVYGKATDLPLTTTSFTATGSQVNFTLNYAPTTGTNLTVVNNTGLGFINGTFSNLVQGQIVKFNYNGYIYSFVANYYGGTGNDLVLLWAGNRPMAWGQDTYSQLGNNNPSNFLLPVGVVTTGVLAGKTVTKVAAGASHTLALCSDGTLAAWGGNFNGQLGNNSTTPSVVPVLVTATGVLSGKTVTAIAAGFGHSLALCSDGTVVGWGQNVNGQLGNNSTTQSTVPVAVTTSGVLSGKTVTAISVGSGHSIALCSDGTVAAWGSSGNGQLGNNSTTQSNVPVLVTANGVLSGKTVTAIAAGSSHNLARCSDGTVVSWGYNSNGQLGNNSTTQSTVPVAVTTTATGLAGKSVSSISAGGFHSMALCSDGTVAMWGMGGFGQLGNNLGFDSYVAVAVNSYGSLVGKTVSGIAAGFYHSLVRCSDGSMVAWGYNLYGQLGNNSTTQSNVPVLVSTSVTPLAGKTVSLISAGQYHNLAICSDGTVAGWGNGANGQLGNNVQLYFPTPVATTTAGTPLAGKTVIAEAAGQYHSLALCSDGTLTAWGYNTSGQLGNGSTSNSLVPTAVSQLGVLLSKTVVAVSAGQYHSLALCSDGTVAAWGANGNGQFGNSSTTNSNTPVAVTTTGVLAGKTVVAVSAGLSHSLALCSDGTLAAWGYNVNGQLGNNSTTQSTTPVAVATTGVLAGKTVIAVSAGQYHSLALCSDGTLVAWGHNLYGQLGNGSTTQSTVPVVVNPTGKTAVALAAGQYHSLALCSDGTVVSWGYNFYGQLGNSSTTNSSVPVAVSTSGTALAGRTVSTISAGLYHSTALCSDGTAVTWGYDVDGELGNSTTTNSSVPVAVSTASLAAGEVCVQAVSGQSAYHTLALVAAPLAPQLVVQQPAGSGLASGSSIVDFGAIVTGMGTAQVFTLLNTGAAPLSLSAVTIDGANAADFVVTKSAATSIAVGGSTTLTVTFTPAAGLGRSAAIHFVSNDPTTASFDVALTGYGTVALAAAYNSAATVPLTTGSFQATGSTVNFTLGYAPSAGTNFTVVNNTGLGFIAGRFSNLAQGQDVAMSYGGRTYHFAANYYGGTGNDLVLQWAYNRPMAWGLNSYGQLGNNAPTTFPAPAAVSTAGVLAGKTVTSISAGQYHTVALCSDGTLAAWGYNSNGQLGNNSTTNSNVPVAVITSGTALAGKTVIAVSAGGYHTAALCSDGTVAAWGWNFYGQLGNNSTTQSNVPVAVSTSGALAGKTATAVVAGFDHTIALCSDGTAVAWGYNFYGQLGNNSTTNSSVPVAVTNSGVLAGKTVRSVAAGQYHCVVSCSDGTAAAWGQNSFGQLGNNSTTNSSVPVAVTASGVLAGKTVASVSAGYYHCLALCSDGTMAAWGYNAFGQLGNNSTSQSTVPVAVSTSGLLAGKTVAAMAAGYYHNTALCTDGTVAVWGYNNNGQLGIGSYSSSSVPVAVSSSGSVLTGKTVIAVSAGYYHSAVLCSDGTAAAWGSNFYGQLGNAGPTTFPVPVPVTTAGTPLSGKTLIAHSAGGGHSLGLCSDGTLAAWGYNLYGQLGNNSTTNSSVPVTVTTSGTALAGKTVVAVSAGQYHSMALCSDGTMVAWGYNAFGQLGNNSTTNSNVPVAVITSGTALAGKTVVAVSAGQYHSLALCSDGTVTAWGYNGYGQLGNNTTTSSSVPVAVTTSGTVLVGKSVTAVSAGQSHSMALCSDGTTVSWGYNNSGQLGNNSTANSSVPVAITTSGVLAGKTVVAVCAGQYHSLALSSDGTVAAWGYNLFGQLGNNSTTQSTVPVAVSTSGVLAGKTVTAVSAALYHSMALCSDSTVATWGTNSNGELGNNSLNSSIVPVVVSTGSLAVGEQFTQVSTGSNASHNLAIVAQPQAPAIFVQQNVGTNLISGAGSADFGVGNVGASVAQTFTVGNSGRVDLSISAVTIDGANAAEYAVTTAPAGTVASGATTTFVVTFTPAGPLSRSAVLHLVSNDPYTSPFNINLAGTAVSTISANYNSAADVPATAATINLNGSTVNFALNYAPVPGTSLTVVNNTGSSFINGRFTNLPQGQDVAITYGGKTYHFVANYYGGTGNDLVLVWAANRPMAWGLNSFGQLGDNVTSTSAIPVAVRTDGVLAGKTVASVAAGYSSTVALCSDGTLAAWGNNTNGQLGNNGTTQSAVPVAVTVNGVLAGKTVTAVAAGASHALALCSDGTLAAWGHNLYGQLGNNSTTQSSVPVAVSTTGAMAGKTVVAVAAGYYHSMALCSDGTVFAWGYNFYGQLGNNSTTNSSVPVAVTTSGTALAGKTVSAVAAGQYHSLASCSDGTVAAWGYNAYGQLGNNSTTNSSVPVAVTTSGALAGKTVTRVSAGFTHSLALCSDGKLVTWGNNTYGQLGNNSTTQSTVPVAVSTSGVLAGKTVIRMAGGASHTLALCSDGTLTTWGYNFYGQLGGNGTANSSVPVDVSISGVLAGKAAAVLSAGNSYSVALCLDGTVASWGSNFNGQLGSGGGTSFPVPTPVSTAGTPLSGKTLIAQSAGGAHSLGLCSDGTLAAWGSNSNGQMGNNSTTDSSVPVAVSNSGVLAGKTVVAVAAGASHSLALCSDGTVAAWGYNSNGQLGNNTTTDSKVPVAVTTSGVLAGKTVISVTAGLYHSLVLCSDGTVIAWGYNVFGQLGNNSTTQSTVPVAVTTSGVLAGKTVSAVAAGQYHSLAVCSDGTVATWGYNTYGQLGNNSTTNSSVPVAVTTGGVLAGKAVVSVSAGSGHSLALCSDGTVAAWGYNTYGQLGNNSTTNSSVPVAVLNSGVLAGKTPVTASAGLYHSMAFCSDGTIATWGDSSYGELGNNSTSQSSVPVAVNTSSLAAGEQFVQACTGSNAYHNLAIVAQPLPSPLLFVQQNVGTNLLNGSTVDFGGATVGTSVTQTLMVGNSGTVDLSVTGAFIDGVNAADFSITTPPAGTVTSGATTTVVVTFAPGASLGRSAALHLVSNDPFTGTFNLSLAGTGTSDITASYNSAADVPVTTALINATGSTVNPSLNFAPAPGTQLTVINNTGLGFIGGAFSNLAHGQAVNLSYHGVTYKFVASYYGGTGNDLVLMWAGIRPLAWGWNISGELGNNSTTDSSIPTAVTTAATPLANRTLLTLAGGYEHSLALCSDGTLAAWGYNLYGQLGNNSFNNSSLPVPVTTAGTALAGKIPAIISTGYEHNLVLCADGTLAAWGLNSFGQLGNNTTTNSGLPVAVTTAGTALAGKSVVAIGSGYYHCLALCSDGTVSTWGYNFYGQLGVNTTTNSSLPVAVMTAGTPLAGKTVVATSVGGNHNLALCSDGTLAAWGQNTNGQLGNGSTTNSSVPVAVTTAGTPLAGKTIVDMAAGYAHNVVLCSDGTLVTWGYNITGQLGNGSTTNSSVPVAVTTAGTPLAGKTVVGVTAGYYYSMATCSDGTVVAWGYNGNGQLGNNSIVNSSVAVAVNSSALATGEVFMLAAGGVTSYHTLALAAMPLPPSATTLAATAITGVTAALNAAVNANGGGAGVSFDYGLDTSYGSHVAAAPATVTGSSSTAVNVVLTGLVPATMYHFRVNAADGSGTASGADMVFTTPDTNANLSSLTLSVGTLSPVFGSGVLAYAVAMPNATTSFTVTPAASSSSAAITVNGTTMASGAASGAITLSGDNMTINVVVTAQDGTTVKTYALNISRNTVYQDWAIASNLTGTNNSPTADADGDGIPNLLEYAFNSSPTSADKNILPKAVSSVNPADGKHYFTFNYRRRIVPGTLTYVLESSANLAAWSAIQAQNLEQVGSTAPTGDGVTEVITFRLLPSIDDAPAAKFMRLKVTP